MLPNATVTNATTPLKSEQLASALLDAHVAYTVAQLQGPALQRQLETTLDALLADASQLKLKQVVSVTAVQETASAYAVRMQLGAGMPELVGEIARKLYQHKGLGKARLGDLLSDRMVEDLIDKLLELEALREALVHESVSNPVYSTLISELIYQALRDYAGSSRVAGMPGARAAARFGRRVVDRARPELAASVEQTIKERVQRNTQARLQASQALLLDGFESGEARQFLLDRWAELKPRKLSTLREFATSLDIEELFVIGYQCWQQLREVPLFSELMHGGIEVFFSKYANTTLTDLLDEVGVTRDMMLADAMRFAPPVIAALQKKRLLEPAIRRQLAGFYASPEATAILAQQSELP